MFAYNFTNMFKRLFTYIFAYGVKNSRSFKIRTKEQT